MKSVNQTATPLPLAEFMSGPDGWGRAQGRETYPKLLEYVERSPGKLVFMVTFQGVRRIDISFASETIVELAVRCRPQKGVCLVGLTDPDMLENIDAAAVRKGIPLTAWVDGKPRIMGLTASKGNEAALRLALSKSSLKAAELAAKEEISIANASTKLKQLWEQGFLLRREEVAESGGIEFAYVRIG